MKRMPKKVLTIVLALVLLSTGLCAAAESESEAVLVLPSMLKIIGEEAFCENTSIGKVIVPEGAAEIRSKAFAGSSLTALELPSTLTYIAEDAFEGCGEFELSVPENCYAYDRCIELGLIDVSYTTASGLIYRMIYNQVTIIGYAGAETAVIIPDEIEGKPVVGIAQSAFENCSGMASITIPETVTHIGEHAFDNCGVMTIYGFEGSAAQSYAEENGIDFCAIGIAVPVPSIVKVENWDKDKVRIEWSEVAGIDGVYLYRSSAADFSSDMEMMSADSGENFCIDSQLIDGTTYYYRLQAFDRHDDGTICVSAFSNVWMHLFTVDSAEFYDADAAVAYARKWSGADSEWGHEGYNNAQYYAYTQSNGYSGNQDCTNYVSQCLHAGGLPMDDVWYSNWKGSTAWINGYRLSIYLVETLGYEGYAESEILASRILPGDAVYTQLTTSGSHVMIVSKVEGDTVYCCSHTRNSLDKAFDVSEFVYHIAMRGT